MPLYGCMSLRKRLSPSRLLNDKATAYIGIRCEPNITCPRQPVGLFSEIDLMGSSKSVVEGGGALLISEASHNTKRCPSTRRTGVLVASDTGTLRGVYVLFFFIQYLQPGASHSYTFGG